jgi:hypothetical protein
MSHVIQTFNSAKCSISVMIQPFSHAFKELQGKPFLGTTFRLCQCLIVNAEDLLKPIGSTRSQKCFLHRSLYESTLTISRRSFYAFFYFVPQYK